MSEILKEEINDEVNEEITQNQDESADDNNSEAEPVKDDKSNTDTDMSEQLKAAIAKSDEYLTMAQRVQADFDNFRKRNVSVRKEAFDSGSIEFAKTLLPVLDNFERALSADTDTSNENLLAGIKMVQQQLISAFNKRGIVAIDRIGEKFDPNLEEAVTQGSEEEGEPGTVCEVFQKGYRINETVLRHAMVKVVPE